MKLKGWSYVGFELERLEFAKNFDKAAKLDYHLC
jgi:hypothetical protein